MPFINKNQFQFLFKTLSLHVQELKMKCLSTSQQSFQGYSLERLDRVPPLEHNLVPRGISVFKMVVF